MTVILSVNFQVPSGCLLSFYYFYYITPEHFNYLITIFLNFCNLDLSQVGLCIIYVCFTAINKHFY